MKKKINIFLTITDITTSPITKTVLKLKSVDTDTPEYVEGLVHSYTLKLMELHQTKVALMSYIYEDSASILHETRMILPYEAVEGKICAVIATEESTL